jgi:hypothetical protein
MSSASVPSVVWNASACSPTSFMPRKSLRARLPGTGRIMYAAPKRSACLSRTFFTNLRRAWRVGSIFGTESIIEGQPVSHPSTSPHSPAPWMDRPVRARRVFVARGVSLSPQRGRAVRAGKARFYRWLADSSACASPSARVVWSLRLRDGAWPLGRSRVLANVAAMDLASASGESQGGAPRQRDPALRLMHRGLEQPTAEMRQLLLVVQL